ncbi:hypothetical protein KIPB_000957 [Kipferlia bialata]|uniref:N-acetyltransferase domain-containing protein n=1 Tax=Kipferlia bialata TaxID=797122 RepID=A0A9K3CQ20_9EUKA|nr:hypothetical protein KIPB_000957 [Kipferlia bialata]|eukprot:g957.t1
MDPCVICSSGSAPSPLHPSDSAAVSEVALILKTIVQQLMSAIQSGSQQQVQQILMAMEMKAPYLQMAIQRAGAREVIRSGSYSLLHYMLKKMTQLPGIAEFCVFAIGGMTAEIECQCGIQAHERAYAKEGVYGVQEALPQLSDALDALPKGVGEGQFVGLLLSRSLEDTQTLLALPMQQALLSGTSVYIADSGIAHTARKYVTQLGFVTQGPLLVCPLESLPPQSDMDRWLEDTDFRSSTDRMGTRHRVYLPDRSDHLQAACRTMAESFVEDPVAMSVFPVAEERPLIVNYNLLNACTQGVRCSGVWTLIPDGSDVTQPSAVLLGAPPGWYDHLYTPLPPHLRVPPPPVCMDRLARSRKCLRTIFSDHESMCGGRNHYYVHHIATQSDWRGKGVGSMLLRRMTEICDRPENKTRIYLENSNTDNLGFYGRVGLTIRKRIVIDAEVGRHTVYVMRRETGGITSSGSESDAEGGVPEVEYVVRDATLQ